MATGNARMMGTMLAGVLLFQSGGAGFLTAAQKVILVTPEGGVKQTTKRVSFYCNTRALTPAERMHHKELTEKLMKVKRAVLETPKGYEFQYDPKEVSLAELTDWVAAEAKCCPFFDFHIDVEGRGNLLCLRLTGQDGVKEFIRSEFQLQER